MKRPMNSKLVQFGIFSKELSIEEQMVPYYGRHSCKMFIRGKPIRFGFKNWIICSPEGYPFKVIPYQGKEAIKSGQPLGSRVVNKLCEILQDPERHEIFFDNFFTSFDLLEDLREKYLKATGTIRKNRLGACPVTPLTEMKRTERGIIDVCCSRNLCVVQWHDNQIVAMASNNLQSSPTVKCNRYSKAHRSPVSVLQPQMIASYNQFMGGVDLLDEFINNLRPCIGGKKWYWTPMINLFR